MSSSCSLIDGLVDHGGIAVQCLAKLVTIVRLLLFVYIHIACSWITHIFFINFALFTPLVFATIHKNIILQTQITSQKLQRRN